MLEYIGSFLTLVVLFFFVAFVLVKLYEHGFRYWFIQSLLVVFGLWYFVSKPKDYVFSGPEIWVALTITAACIFTVDRNSAFIKVPQAKTKPEVVEEHSESNGSWFQTFLNAFLLYSAWSYFFDDEENE